jgi:hypothetical protein
VDQAVLVLLLLSRPQERLVLSTDFLLVVGVTVDLTASTFINKRLRVLLVVGRVVITLCLVEPGIKDFLVEHQSLNTAQAAVGLVAQA